MAQNLQRKRFVPRTRVTVKYSRANIEPDLQSTRSTLAPYVHAAHLFAACYTNSAFDGAARAD
jgi:hypothetical protein